MKKITVLLLLMFLAACTGVDNRDFAGLKTTPAKVRLGEIVRLAYKCPSEMLSKEDGDRASGGLREALSASASGVIASTGAQFAVDAIQEAISDYRAPCKIACVVS
ncbi:hypothetical protein [Candidatus Thiosymbion oneisti]|uniref:hypothetical protein n=1 Tax=Candidatus Thiosymbion oneisti TaxID=589554 RepID=UPI000B800C6A|nr:hypothetical protein [Candidatus Thiosymbion oneisti]